MTAVAKIKNLKILIKNIKPSVTSPVEAIRAVFIGITAAKTIETVIIII